MRPLLLLLTTAGCHGGKGDICDGKGDRFTCADAGTAVSCDGGQTVQTECDASEVCLDGAGCVDCALSFEVPYSNGQAAPLVRLETAPVTDFAARRLQMRPVTLNTAGDDELTLDGEGVVAWLSDGTTSTLPWTLPASQAGSLLLQGVTEGDAWLSATWAAESACDGARLELRVGSPFGLAGRSLSSAPWFERVVAFLQGGDRRLAGRRGQRVRLGARTAVAAARERQGAVDLGVRHVRTLRGVVQGERADARVRDQVRQAGEGHS